MCLVQQRDPIQTAKLVASLDQVSNGRFLFGVGGGWNQDEMENHGTEFKTRFKLMRERIEAMKEIWTKSKAQYHGDMVDFDEMMAWPKPVQKPHPPILVGGGFPQAARRAIRYGDGWCPIGGRRVPARSTRWSNSARWRATPGAIRNLCRSPCSTRPRMRAARALPRHGGRPRRRHAALGAGRQDPADPRPLGRPDPPHRTLKSNVFLGQPVSQFISIGGYSRNTLAAVTRIWCVTVRGGRVSPASSRRASGSTS